MVKFWSFLKMSFCSFLIFWQNNTYFRSKTLFLTKNVHFLTKNVVVFQKFQHLTVVEKCCRSRTRSLEGGAGAPFNKTCRSRTRTRSQKTGVCPALTDSKGPTTRQKTLWPKFIKARGLAALNFSWPINQVANANVR